jgi:hypothetical protein
MIHILVTGKAMSEEEAKLTIETLKGEVDELKERVVAIEEFLYDRMGELP